MLLLDLFVKVVSFLVTKKKSKKISLNSGTISKRVLLLMLVLGLQVIFCSTSYAYMTLDYLDYGLETLKDNWVSSNSSIQSGRRTDLTAFFNDSTAKLQLLQAFNNQLDTWGIPNVSDRNIICVFQWSSSAGNRLKILVCNNSFPGQYDNLDFYLLTNNKLYAYSNNSTDIIYQYNVTFSRNASTNLITLSNFEPYTLPADQYCSLELGTTSFTSDTLTVLNVTNLFCCGLPGGFAHYPLNNTSSDNIIAVILKDANGNYQIPSPEPTPSGDSGDYIPSGTITNPSGEVTGNIDLTGIENGLTNIQNQISGDSQKIINTISGETQKVINTLTDLPDLSGETITSNQITDNIDFGLINNNSTLNGYSNFWFDLTNGLRSALTGNVRSINIDFRDETYTISLDDFAIQLPQQLKFILNMTSTIYFIFIIIKWWKIIIDKITSGDIDEVLALNEEERHCRFILGGCFNA